MARNPQLEDYIVVAVKEALVVYMQHIVYEQFKNYGVNLIIVAGKQYKWDTLSLSWKNKR